MGEFSPPHFLSLLLSFFFLFLKYWNNIWFLWHYCKNSPPSPISKSWLRPCVLLQFFRGYRSAWFLLLHVSTCRFVNFDASVICHVLMHYYGWFQVFAFERQNMKFNVKMLLTCITYCDAGPGCDKKCLKVRYHIWYVFLRRRSSFALRKLYSSPERFLFPSAIWSSLSFWSSFDRSSTTWTNAAVYTEVCWLFCVLYMPLFHLVQTRTWFRFAMWISSVASISKILRTSEVASSTRMYVRV